MFRSRSRGFYLYMFLRSWTERERGRERELDNLAIRYIYSFIEYCFSVRYCAARKGIQQYFSLSLFRYDSNLLDWILDGCIRTREPYTIPLPLSLSLFLSLSLEVEGLTNEERIESLVCKFSRRVNGEICMAANPGKRSSPYVRRSSCFFHSCTVLRSIIQRVPPT